MHGLHIDKRDIPAEESHNFNKAKRNSLGGGLKPRLKTPRRVEAAGLPRHHIPKSDRTRGSGRGIRMLGYLLSPTSGPPTSKLGLWYNMNQKKGLQHATEALRGLPLIAIAVRLTAALIGPVHQLRTGGLPAGE